VPTALPVTRPDEPTDAIDGVELIHIPPAVVSDNGVVVPTQPDNEPRIGPTVANDAADSSRQSNDNRKPFFIWSSFDDKLQKIISIE